MRRLRGVTTCVILFVAVIAVLSCGLPSQFSGSDDGLKQVRVVTMGPLLENWIEPVVRSVSATGIKGSVSLLVLVGPGGRVRDSEVVSSSGYSVLDAAALEAANKSTFTPARAGDRTIPTWTKLVYEFPSVSHDISPCGASAIDAKIVNWAKPIYPEEARRSQVEGTVVVQAVISRQGNVAQAGVIRSVDPNVDDAAIEATFRCRFAPASVECKSVSGRIDLPFNFRLH